MQFIKSVLISAFAALACLVLAPALNSASAGVQTSTAAGPTALAQSPWPKMLGNARNAGAGTALQTGPGIPWLLETLGVYRRVGGAPALDADGTLYIGADGLYALDGATGKKKWMIDYGGGIFNCSPVVGYDKAVYTGTEDGNFCKVDGRTGAVKWRFASHSEPARPWTPAETASGFPQNNFHGFYGGGALGADGIVYTTSLEGNLYALDCNTGEEKWRFATHQQIYSSPAIGANGAVYFSGVDANIVNALFAVDGKTGKFKWSVEHCYVSGPVPLAADGTVYTTVETPSGNVKHPLIGIAALDGETGAQKWLFSMGQGGAAQPAVGEDGTVYVGWFDSAQELSHGIVYAIDGKTGRKKWAVPTDRGVYMALAIGIDGTLYIGSQAGTMYALDGSTGVKKWTQEIGARIDTPVAVGTNGLIYFGTDDGIVYALRAKDGSRAPRPHD